MWRHQNIFDPAMRFDPIVHFRRYPPNDTKDALVILLQMPLENWLVMSDPVAEGA